MLSISLIAYPDIGFSYAYLDNKDYSDSSWLLCHNPQGDLTCSVIFIGNDDA